MKCHFEFDLRSMRDRCIQCGVPWSPGDPIDRVCLGVGVGRVGCGPGQANYIDRLNQFVSEGKATRSMDEIERLLDVCRTNRCGEWTLFGCRIYCGCDGSTFSLFAHLLAHAPRTCRYWPDEKIV